MPGVGLFERLGLRRAMEATAADDPEVAMSKDEMLAAYIIREHKQGRTLEDILDDPYLKNRTRDEHRRRLLERPDVIRAVGEDTAAAAQQYLRGS